MTILPVPGKIRAKTHVATQAGLMRLRTKGGSKGGLKWPDAKFTTVINGTHAQGSLTHPINVQHPHWNEIAAFCDCVQNGKPSPVPWTETIKVIGILEALYTSSTEGREVAVKG